MEGFERDVPEYFICPISLEIMKEPVTAVTGITYDKDSIERWLFTAKEATCPVTNQPLSRDSGLTPNHTLHRLIQAWRTGVVMSQKSPPLYKARVLDLLRDLDNPRVRLRALKTIESLATESESNRKCMEEAGTVSKIATLIVILFKRRTVLGIEEALRILNLIWNPTTTEAEILASKNYDLVDCITWVLNIKVANQAVVKTQAVLFLKSIIEAANPSFIRQLKPEFFEEIIKVLREKTLLSQKGIKATLHVMVEICNCSKNRLRIIEVGGVFELIELELLQEKHEKKITELIFCVLAQLCSCAEGRSQFLLHAGGIAMVTKRLLRVSPTTDDRGVYILGSVSRLSATCEVLSEMLRVGAVSKLCMVLQANSTTYLKNNAREILRLHSSVWHDSPCIAVYLLTRYHE